MRYQPVNIGLLQIIGGQCFIDNPSQGIDCHLEHLIALHLYIGLPGLHLVIAARYTRRHRQQMFVTAVSMQVSGKNAGLIARFQYHGAGTVAKQDAGTAIIPVDNAGQGFRTHHQCTFCGTGLDKLVCDPECVDEPRAYGLHIKGSRAVNIQPLLQQAGRTWKHTVRCRRRQYNQVYLPWRDPRSLHCIVCCNLCQVTGGLITGGNMPLVDTGTLPYPFIGGIHDLFKIMVGQYFFRQVTAGTRDT